MKINFKVGLTTNIIHKYNQDIDVQRSGQTFYVPKQDKNTPVSGNVKEKNINVIGNPKKSVLSHHFGM